MQSHGEGNVMLPTPAAFPSFLLHPVLMPPWANHSLCSWAASLWYMNHFIAQLGNGERKVSNKSRSNKCRTAEITEGCLQNTNELWTAKCIGSKTDFASSNCFLEKKMDICGERNANNEIKVK